MNIKCLFGFHERKLVHSRTASIGDFEWYECKNCDKKLFTVNGNVWGNDKWKKSWHKTPEQDKKMYDENGEIREEALKEWYEKKEWKNEVHSN